MYAICPARRSTILQVSIGRSYRKSMKQDGKESARQDRLKLALRENLKRRKSQARGRNEPAASSAGRKASLDDGDEEKELD
jgi:hypothetical protein